MAFLEKAPMPNGLMEGPELLADFGALPQLIFENIDNMPKLFKMMQAECYIGQDVDLHLQLAGAMSIVLNRQI